MPLYKSAQVLNVEDLSKELGSDEVILYEEKPSDEDVVELHKPEEETLEIMLKLPSIPGSTIQDIEVYDEPYQVEEKPKASKKDTNNLEVKDPRDWRSWGPARALEWAQYMFENIPKHSGQTTGIERNISYLEKMDRDLSKMIAEDYAGEVDIVKFEQVRYEIRSGIHRLEEAKDRLDSMHKRKKKADDGDVELVKEAKQTAIHGMIITIPVFISRLASTLINGMVSGGKNIEHEYDKLSKEWKLTAREQVELMETLQHFGYAMPLRDRGLPRDGTIDYSSSDNPELNANFPS